MGVTTRDDGAVFARCDRCAKVLELGDASPEELGWHRRWRQGFWPDEDVVRERVLCDGCVGQEDDLNAGVRGESW